MSDRRLPPSRFTAGHTVGDPDAHRATRPVPSAPKYHPPAPRAPLPAVSPEPTNRLAIASFVLAVTLGPLASPAAVPMALAAQRQCATTGQRGVGLAKAAVFVGLAYLALTAIVLVLRFLTGG